MRKLALAILIAAVMAIGLVHFEVAHAVSYESGTISSNVTWTTSGSPYTLSGPVTIASGGWLTIQPGVTVNFGTFQIQVYGALSAQGTINNPITFSGTSIPQAGIVFWATSTSSSISYTNINGLFTTIQQGEVTFNNDYFSAISTEPTITVENGGLTISNSVINIASKDGIDVFGGSAGISNCVIVGQGNCYGIYGGQSTFTTITQSNITGCFTGIWTVGASDIEQNIIMNNANDGVCTSAASTVENNVLASNLCGLSGGGGVEYNTITGNAVGIWSPYANEIIAYNNICGNYNYTGQYTQNIHLTDSNNITAENNWWGYSDSQNIGMTIWDNKNASNLGTVQYSPFLTGPVSSAPQVPTSIVIPTPPPTPSSSLAITPTPYYYQTPTPTPYYYVTPTPTPFHSYLPLQNTPRQKGLFQNTDLDSIIVVAAAFIVAAAIIVAIRVKFGRAKALPPTRHRRRRRSHPKTTRGSSGAASAGLVLFYKCAVILV